MLVAISIPIFTAQLEKSREAVDLSNIRAAYAAAQTSALTGSFGANGDEIDTSKTYYYDATAGTLVESAPANWFKGTTTGSGTDTVAGNITYNRNTAYNSLTIEFSGTAAPYTATLTLN